MESWSHEREMGGAILRGKHPPPSTYVCMGTHTHTFTPENLSMVPWQEKPFGNLAISSLDPLGTFMNR